MKPSPATGRAGDLVVALGKSETFADDVVVDGWIDIKGSLACEGDLTCLGVTVHPGGTLRCRRLRTNLVDVDNTNDDTTVEAESIAARVMKLVQVVASLGVGQPLADRIADGKVDVDYIQHDAGDLNPSWDYEKGRRDVLRPDFLESDEDPASERPPTILVDRIREELALGKNPFTTAPPLIEKTARSTAPTREEVSAPLLDELRAWIATHPGPQRQLAKDLREQWVARLGGAPTDMRDEVTRVVKAVVASPKLRSERDAILEAISEA